MKIIGVNCHIWGVVLCIFYVTCAYFRVLCCTLLQITKKVLTNGVGSSILIKLTHEREVRTKKREERARGFKANTWTVAVRLKANSKLGKKFQRKFSKRISKKYLTTQ